jgi:putative ABC transport system permease protein
VLGASVTQLTMLLSEEFILLVVIAIIIATPLAWLLTNKWLEDFAYRINISGWIFFIAGMIAILIALATVSVSINKSSDCKPGEEFENGMRSEW